MLSLPRFSSRFPLAIFLLPVILVSPLFAQYGVPSNAIPTNRNYTASAKHKEYDITVYLKDSRVIQQRMVLHIKPSPFYTQFIKNGQDTITPAHTDSVIAAGVVGIPFSSTWAWRKVAGRLNIYSREPAPGKTGKYAYLDKTDNSLAMTVYSREILHYAVTDDPEAKKLVKEYELGKTIRNVMFFGGGILAFGAFLMPAYTSQSGKENNIPFIVFCTGCAMVVTSPIPHLWAVNKDKKAIEVYNAHSSR